MNDDNKQRQRQCQHRPSLQRSRCAYPNPALHHPPSFESSNCLLVQAVSRFWRHSSFGLEQMLLVRLAWHHPTSVGKCLKEVELIHRVWERVEGFDIGYDDRCVALQPRAGWEVEVNLKVICHSGACWNSDAPEQRSGCSGTSVGTEPENGKDR